MTADPLDADRKTVSHTHLFGNGSVNGGGEGTRPRIPATRTASMRGRRRLRRGRCRRLRFPGSENRVTHGFPAERATQTRDANRNYAVPSAMTAGSLSSSFSWNGANEMTSTTGPNGATASASYDSYLRPASRTAPNGSVTTFTYGSSVPYWTKATTGTRWTKTTVDGFGRAMTSESGTISG